MPKFNTVIITVYNGKREIWTDYEEAKTYFLELMMSPRVRNVTEQSAFIFSSYMDWRSVRTRMNKKSKGIANEQQCPCFYSLYGLGRYIQASMITSDLVFHVLFFLIKEIIRISFFPQQPSKISHSLQVTKQGISLSLPSGRNSSHGIQLS